MDFFQGNVVNGDSFYESADTIHYITVLNSIYSSFQASAVAFDKIFKVGFFSNLRILTETLHQ